MSFEGKIQLHSSNWHPFFGKEVKGSIMSLLVLSLLETRILLWVLHFSVCVSLYTQKNSLFFCAFQKSRQKYSKTHRKITWFFCACQYTQKNWYYSVGSLKTHRKNTYTHTKILPDKLAPAPLRARPALFSSAAALPSRPQRPSSPAGAPLLLPRRAAAPPLPLLHPAGSGPPSPRSGRWLWWWCWWPAAGRGGGGSPPLPLLLWYFDHVCGWGLLELYKMNFNGRSDDIIT